MTSTLTAKLDALRSAGVSPELSARLGRLISEAPTAKLLRLVPPRLAVEWGVPEHEVLEAFLVGTRQGVFELEWDVRCLACTGPTVREPHLERLRNHASCGLCALESEASFDESVEVTWRVHPSLRDDRDVDFRQVFLAYAEPELVLRLDLDPEGEAATELDLAAGNYHLVKGDLSAMTGLRVTPEPEASAPLLDLEIGPTSVGRGAWSRASGHYQLHARNLSDSPASLLLTRVSDQPWVSGARLAAHQGFRDLFSRELIGHDEGFAIRSAAFVFTDLKGSTELYERIGDSRAYALVREHFRIMVEQVRSHGGAVVKTIGDAVMATFLSSSAALAFSLSVLDTFERFNAAHGEGGDDIIVKVGVHAGPCIAVTLNERLDYFGRTVNTAARIQGLSEGGDVVLSAAVAADPEVASLLGEASWTRTPFVTSLKGIPGAIDLVRLQRRAA